jgi:AcrR family transcriptional regulator
VRAQGPQGGCRGIERIPFSRSGPLRADVTADQRRRIFDGYAAALASHGYEDSTITDIVERAGLSRAAFYEHFPSKEACLVAAYTDGVERLARRIGTAADAEPRWAIRVSDGLRAGLEFLAADPVLARLLLVESLAAEREVRLEHERSLARLADALRPPATFSGGAVTGETLRLVAGGLVSHASSRVLAGETERLPQDHDLLLGFLIAPTEAANARIATG